MQVKEKNTLQRRCCSLQTEKMVLQKKNTTTPTIQEYIFVYTTFGRMSSSVGKKNTSLAQNQDGDAQRTANPIEGMNL